MTTDIYAQFDAATKGLSAYVLLKDGKPVGRVIFKPSASNMSVACYLQIWGLPMVKGTAKGFGYDKRSASFRNAVCKLAKLSIADAAPDAHEDAGAIVDADKATPDGYDWKTILDAACIVAQHVI